MSKCPRKIWDDYIHFKDREAIKHEHDYAIPCLLEKHFVGKNSFGPLIFIKYHEALMCKYCHSFKLVSRPGSFDGYITSAFGDKYIGCKLTKDKEKLPRIVAKVNGKYSELKYIDEFIFPDGKKYTKK